jgi:transcription-repair coupling factor (superfamily II helicase)
VLSPAHLFLNTEQFFTRVNLHAQLALRKADVSHAVDWAQTLPDVTVDRGSDAPLVRLQDRQRNCQSRVLVLAESDGRRESLLDFLRAGGVSPPAFDSLAEFVQSTESLVSLPAVCILALLGQKQALIW